MSHPLSPVDASGNVLAVGARVALVNIPDWLTHDLPLDEAETLRALQGQTRVIVEIDDAGYVWFGSSQDRTSRWFCLQPADVRMVSASD